MKDKALLQKMVVILSLTAALIGVAVLIGWKFDIVLLKSVFANSITMKANTAMALVICGSITAFLPKSSITFYKYFITFAAIIVLSIALLTLYQYIFNANLGIDELLISDKSSALNVGRMSPTTAFCFVNITPAIILSARLFTFPFRKIFIGAFCTTVILIAGSIFFSYLPNMLMNSQILSSSSMGIHTSFALTLLAISLLLFLYKEGNFLWVLDPVITMGCFFCLVFILLSTDTYFNYKNAIQASLKESAINVPTDQQQKLITLKKLIATYQQNVSTSEKKYTADEINKILNNLINDVNTSLTSSMQNLKINVYQSFLLSPLSIWLVIFLLSLGIFILNKGQYERKKTESIRNKLAAIVDSSNDGIISKNLDGIITSWNKGAEHIFGYTEKEMIGHPISVLFPEDRRNEEIEILRQVTNDVKVEHFETTRKRQDGKLINVSVTISPLKDNNNKVIGASKIVRDVTENKRLEKQLRQSQKMSAIGQLSGGIAHDFNNLLGIIIGNLDLLERNIAGNEEALKRTQVALKAATRGADLTKRLLTFSRQQSLAPKAVDLNLSVHNLTEMASQILGNNIKIITDLDTTLPPVFADITELESALLNLIVNARDAMPNGGKLVISTKLRNIDDQYPSVQINEMPSGSYAAISVTDTGSGIPADVLEHVYEPFFTTKERGKGTGMGLSMVYGFAKQSGGTVKIYSEVGHGTTVTIYLPIVENTALPQTEKNQPQKSFTTCKVLVVDDEPDLLEIATLYLKELGFEIYQAHDAASAIEMFRRTPGINLLITDVVMPGEMNGIELAKKIQQMNGNVKVVYVSGFPLGKFSENESTTLTHFLRKPYQREEFINAINKILSQP